MKRAIAMVLAAACLGLSAPPASASTSTVSVPSFGQSLSMAIHPNAISISWEQDSNTVSPYLLPPEIADKVKSLGLVVKHRGANYAVLVAPNAALTEQTLSALKQVATVRHILQHPGSGAQASAGSANLSGAVLLTDELIVHVDPSLSETAKQVLFDRAGVELVRPLRFATSTYLVKSPHRPGLQLLDIAQKLEQFRGVRSARLNVLQASSAQAQLEAPIDLTQLTAGSQFSEHLREEAWHQDSRHHRGKTLPRVDIRATEAWEISDRGAGTLVGVIDATIQWDHADLKGQLACPEVAEEDRLPDETCGYDFVEGDGDTRLSDAELEHLKPQLQDSFRLNDLQLLQKYADLALMLGDKPLGEKAQLIRYFLRFQVEATSHGTWVAGVIAANGGDTAGLLGVAPESKFLPVRVFDLAGFTSTARLIEATGYAAARGVDVINLSLGGLLPGEALVYHLFDLMDRYPDLVIVASAGNSNLDGVSFPAAIPGVISVGATTREGHRAPYSQYGGQLDLVAPGGDLSLSRRGGILTTGGTWLPAFWEGIEVPDTPWGLGFDPLGTYVQVQGTSFSAPNVAGVVALMKGENPGLSRAEVSRILRETSSTGALSLKETDVMHYRLQKELGFGTVLDFPFLRNSGIYQQPDPISAEQYYFGAGLVNAVDAVEASQQP